MIVPEVDKVTFWATLHRVDTWAHNRPGTYGVRVWRPQVCHSQTGTVTGFAVLDNGTLLGESYRKTHTLRAAVVRPNGSTESLLVPLGSLG